MVWPPADPPACGDGALSDAITLVRHTEVARPRLGRCYGASDVPLSRRPGGDSGPGDAPCRGTASLGGPTQPPAVRLLADGSRCLLAALCVSGVKGRAGLRRLVRLPIGWLPNGRLCGRALHLPAQRRRGHLETISFIGRAFRMNATFSIWSRPSGWPLGLTFGPKRRGPVATWYGLVPPPGGIVHDTGWKCEFPFSRARSRRRSPVFRWPALPYALPARLACKKAEVRSWPSPRHSLRPDWSSLAIYGSAISGVPPSDPGLAPAPREDRKVIWLKTPSLRSRPWCSAAVMCRRINTARAVADAA